MKTNYKKTDQTMGFDRKCFYIIVSAIIITSIPAIVFFIQRL